jgi:hypothetical protein
LECDIVKKEEGETSPKAAEESPARKKTLFGNKFGNALQSKLSRATTQGTKKSDNKNGFSTIDHTIA